MTFEYSDTDLIFIDGLIESESKSPLQYPNDGVDTKANCTCTADLRSIDKSLLKKITEADGELYWELHFELVVSIQDANMKFSIEIEGKEMGVVDAAYY